MAWLAVASGILPGVFASSSGSDHHPRREGLVGLPLGQHFRAGSNKVPPSTFPALLFSSRAPTNWKMTLRESCRGREGSSLFPATRSILKQFTRHPAHSKSVSRALHAPPEGRTGLADHVRLRTRSADASCDAALAAAVRSRATSCARAPCLFLSWVRSPAVPLAIH